MARIDVFIPRAKFNSILQISRFLTVGIIKFYCFEVYGKFRTPLKFKFLIDTNDEIEERIVDLSLNKENNSYFPHYLELTVNCLNTKLSVIALTDNGEEIMDAVSFSISFESNDDGYQNRKPSIYPSSKINSSSLQLV